MLTLWMFGTPLERDWGTRRFLKYYFICGIGAGLCDVAVNAIDRRLEHRYRSALRARSTECWWRSASAIPNQTVLMNFLFPIKAKYMVMIYAAIELWMSRGVNTGVSNIAHLGGMAFGFVYLKSGLAGRRSQRVPAGLARRVPPVETAARQEEVPGVHEEARVRAAGRGSIRSAELTAPRETAHAITCVL